MMTIKNLICDLGGVWLPIDEKRTLAAFAALTAGGTALDAAGGPDGRRHSRRDERGDEPQSRREATDGASADAAAAQALAARLQPDVLAYELGAIDDATLLSRLRNALTAAKTAGNPEAQATGQPATETAKAAANHAPGEPDSRRRSRRDERGDELQSRRETTDGASAAGGPDSGTAQATALSDEALIRAWNAMLLPFPEAHLPLLDAYGQRYRLFLLSNTNALHIRYVEQDFQSRFPGRRPFLQHFEKAYLSHELHLRKPQPEIYAHVLRDAALRPEETLFIDDRAENIAAAATLGLHTRLHPANAPLTTLPL